MTNRDVLIRLFLFTLFIPKYSNSTMPPPSVTLTSLIEKSSQFPIKFPIETIRCSSLQSRFPQETLEENINSAYPLIHERIILLIDSFLSHKRKLGTLKERNLYENMTIVTFIDRLLQKRSVMFMGSSDSYILRDGTKGAGNWESIGSDLEKEPLILANYLSYDEIKISAFLSVSSLSIFINDGNRFNRGVFETDRVGIEDSGVIIGLIGPRLSEGDRMEHREIVKSRKQNVQNNGYGQFFAPTLQGIFCNFYAEPSDTYEALENFYESHKDKYLKIGRQEYFSVETYKKRIAFSIETLLIEANHRAKLRGTFAYVHVVGLGLGVWKVFPGQNKLFLEACVESLKNLGSHLHNISDVCFAYIGEKRAGIYKNGDTISIEGHPKGGIEIHIENRQPHVKMTGRNEGKLLVVSYAWDGNALPGNEFWDGSLGGSGDPAAASSTQISELHNPHINPLVSGKNTKIATALNGIVGIEKYLLKLHKK